MTTDFPDLKLKALVSFPTTIADGVGVDTVKQNGTYQFNLAYDDFAPPGTLSDLNNQCALFWNQVTKEYLLAPAASLSGTGGAFIQGGVGAISRTMQDKVREFVSITDFGAIGDGSSANAATNATAVTNALATGKTVFIPWTANGYHFGTNTIVVASGQYILGERQVLLKSTASTCLFRLTGQNVTSGIANVAIDMTASGPSSTAIRFGTASGIVYRVRLDRLRFANCVEAIGDEGSNYIFDFMITDTMSWLTRGRQIHFSNVQGFGLLRSVTVDFTQDTIQPAWSGIQIDYFAGLELERVDVLGHGPGVPIFNNTIAGIQLGSASTASLALWLTRVFIDSFHGNAINIINTSFVFGIALESSLVIGNGIGLSNVTNGVFVNTVANGASGQPGAASGAYGLALTVGCANNSFNGVLVTANTGSGILVNSSNNNNFSGLVATNNGFSLAMQGTAAGNLFINGQSSGNTFPASITTTGTGNIISNIVGYNPVGAAIVTTGASPWAYTAGLSAETLYVSASTSITQITQSGVNILPQATSANTNFTIQLGPNESITITYTGTLIAKKMVH